MRLLRTGRTSLRLGRQALECPRGAHLNNLREPIDDEQIRENVEADVAADAMVLDPIRDGHDLRHREWRDVVADSHGCFFEDH